MCSFAPRPRSPLEVHDMLSADTRFKVLVFAVNILDDSDTAKLQGLSDDSELNRPEGRYGHGDFGKWQVFDLLCFSSAKKDKVGLFDFPSPEFFRTHWTKALFDDMDMHGKSESDGYAKYGIDKHGGAIVVVRPDGYAGTVAPLDGVGLLMQI